MSKKKSYLNKQDTERPCQPNFGQNLKKAFRAIGLKAKDIAKDLDVSPVTVSRWLNDNRKISIELLYLFKERYGINPNFILTGEGEPVIKSHTRERILFIEKRKAELSAQIKSLKKILESLERELAFWERESKALNYNMETNDD